MSSAAASVANFIVSLVDGVDTTLQHQPNRPSGSVLRARRRVLFGVQLPSSAAGNDFADLYSPDGLSMTFQSRADVSYNTVSCSMIRIQDLLYTVATCRGRH
jgi:hypothetical protein